MSLKSAEFLREIDKYMDETGREIIDVWTGNPTSVEWIGDGLVYRGMKHERMTRAEYRRRFPDDDDDG